MSLLKESKTFSIRGHTRINFKINSGITHFKLVFLNNYSPAADYCMFYTVIPRNWLKTILFTNIAEMKIKKYTIIFLDLGPPFGLKEQGAKTENVFYSRCMPGLYSFSEAVFVLLSDYFFCSLLTAAIMYARAMKAPGARTKISAAN